MIISVDLSMYPLKEGFELEIETLILKLRKSPFKILENPLSTQIFGPYDDVMKWLQTELKPWFKEIPHLVFTLKIIGGDRGDYQPHF